MARPARILVRVDATRTSGLGHAVRSAALVARLPASVEVRVVGSGDALPGLFPRAAICAPERDAAATVRGLGETWPWDLFLCDLPEPDPDLWRVLDATPGVLVVSIDDYGEALPSDLVINGTVLPEYHRYPRLRPGGEVLAGADFALIRACFRASREAAREGDGLIAVAGSGRAAGAFARALSGVDWSREGWSRVSLVVGEACRDFESVQAACRHARIELLRGIPGEQLARRLAACGVALVTGGMIVYECLAAGVPTVVYPQEPNLIGEIRWFAGRGCVVDLGHSPEPDLPRMLAATAALRDDRDRAAQLAARGAATIDGLGVERAAVALRARLPVHAEEAVRA